MQISGHRTESVYKRYDIASERGAIRAGETMENFFQILGTNGHQGKIGHQLGTKAENRIS